MICECNDFRQNGPVGLDLELEFELVDLEICLELGRDVRHVGHVLGPQLEHVERKHPHIFPSQGAHCSDKVCVT